jgi:hypothetical protein
MSAISPSTRAANELASRVHEFMDMPKESMKMLGMLAILQK